MSDRVQTALDCLAPLAGNDVSASDCVHMAQVYATLALVEQQRIANLIALAESGRTTVSGARQALSAMYDGTSEDGTANMSLRPDIATALGIEVESHD